MRRTVVCEARDVGCIWDSERVDEDESLTVWDRLRQYATTQSGPFTSQEALSWFRRHAPSQANDRTVRTHIRGACWNVGDRSQFSKKEPFLTRIDRGLFRLATLDEVEHWRGDCRHEEASPGHPDHVDQEVGSAASDVSAEAAVTTERESAEATPVESEWHTEANVQALLVTALATDGWRILSVANTATKEHGIDVIASRDGQTVGIEVKGFPSRAYEKSHACGRTEAHEPEHPSRPLVRTSGACRNATSREGTDLAQRDRLTGFPALSRPAF
jgi:hypothetical protein